MAEKNWGKQITQRLTDLLGKSAAIDFSSQCEKSFGKKRCVFDYLFTVQIGKETYTLLVEVKTKVQKSTIMNLIELTKMFKKNTCLLIACDYLTPGDVEFLSDNEIFALDTLGNGYIKLPGVYHRVSGLRDPAVSVRGNTFSKKGRWVANVLLKHPERKWTLKQLEDEAGGIAYGTCQRIVRLLEKDQYVERDKNGFYIRQGMVKEMRSRIE